MDLYTVCLYALHCEAVKCTGLEHTQNVSFAFIPLQPNKRLLAAHFRVQWQLCQSFIDICVFDMLLHTWMKTWRTPNYITDIQDPFEDLRLSFIQEFYDIF